MQATTLQEIVDSACEWIDQRAEEEPGSVIVDGTMYSPSSRAIPGLEEVWQLHDPEAWEYVDGKVDDHVTECGHYWEDGILRKGEIDEPPISAKRGPEPHYWGNA